MRKKREVLILGVCLMACTGEPPTMPSSIDARPFVTGEAARNLSASGQFQLGESPSGELTEAQARALAAAYTRAGARWLSGVWEEDRHGAIDFDEISVCPRAYYARSVFDLSGKISKGLRETLGGQWILAMCTPTGAPVLSVSVAALATDLSVVDGHIMGPSGGQFFSEGIPSRLSAVPITPENAVKMAAEASGARVSEVPELVLTVSGSPPLAKWRIRLERAVSIRAVRTGAVRSTNEIYVGFGATWNSVEIQIGDTATTTAERRDGAAGGAIISLPVISGYPVIYETARVQP